MAARRLLVVDDEKDITIVMKLGLERQGFRIDAVNRPTVALEKFRQNEYDMAILDVRMPEMDGFTLYEKMLETKKGARVCFMTAFDKEHYRTFREKFGSSLPDRCFINKPVTIQDLVRVINAELDLAPTGVSPAGESTTAATAATTHARG